MPNCYHYFVEGNHIDEKGEVLQGDELNTLFNSIAAGRKTLIQSHSDLKVSYDERNDTTCFFAEAHGDVKDALLGTPNMAYALASAYKGSSVVDVWLNQKVEHFEPVMVHPM